YILACPIGCADSNVLNILACPIGCADRQCFSTGCIKCQPGYCRAYHHHHHHHHNHHNHVETAIVVIMYYISACKDSNCKRCSSANNCQECKYRYELENGECRRKLFG
ncbi:hypothetical protein LOTGIDRAFT_176773, partial [Lottia gigantea]